MSVRCVTRRAACAIWLLLTAASAADAQNATDLGALTRQPFVHMTGDVLGYELRPSFNGTFKRAVFRTNRWGMRDQEYSLAPAAGTYRIALVGSSYTMGAGVSASVTLEAIIEERLNREAVTKSTRAYEILNFSVGGYGVLENLVVVDKKVFPFSPNAVMLVLHSVEDSRLIGALVTIVRNDTRIEYPYVQRALQKAGVRHGMEEPELRRRISAISKDLVRWSYAQIAERCQRNGVPLIGIAFPIPGPSEKADDLAEVVAAATAAGIRVLSLGRVYDGQRLADITLLAPTPRRPNGDTHLNELGHRLVAERLFQLLRENDSHALKIGFPNAQPNARH
jgi:hypothetical protein